LVGQGLIVRSTKHRNIAHGIDKQALHPNLGFLPAQWAYQRFVCSFLSIREGMRWWQTRQAMRCGDNVLNAVIP
jgi:hypothetical protein